LHDDAVADGRGGWRLEQAAVLPASESDRTAFRSGQAAPYAPPATPTEELLAQIWSAVLGVSRVGRHDHFWDRGGHSLLATQTVSRIRRQFAVHLPCAPSSEAPSLAGLALAVDQARQRTARPVAIPEIATAVAPPVASYAQQRLWFLDQLTPGNAAYNIPMVWRLRGALDVPALEKALARIVDGTAPCALGSCSRTERSSSASTPTSVRRSLSRTWPASRKPSAGRRLRRSSRRRRRRPSISPPGRSSAAAWCAWPKTEHVLVVTAHHIVWDGWSAGVFVGGALEPLRERRDGRRRVASSGSGADIPDFAHWQRGWLQGEALAAELAF
jgi:hypothetical protein